MASRSNTAPKMASNDTSPAMKLSSGAASPKVSPRDKSRSERRNSKSPELGTSGKAKRLSIPGLASPAHSDGGGRKASSRRRSSLAPDDVSQDGSCSSKRNSLTLTGIESSKRKSSEMISKPNDVVGVCIRACVETPTWVAMLEPIAFLSIYCLPLH